MTCAEEILTRIFYPHVSLVEICLGYAEGLMQQMLKDDCVFLKPKKQRQRTSKLNKEGIELKQQTNSQQLATIRRYLNHIRKEGTTPTTIIDSETQLEAGSFAVQYVLAHHKKRKQKSLSSLSNSHSHSLSSFPSSPKSKRKKPKKKKTIIPSENIEPSIS